MTETLETRAVARCADDMGKAILYLRALRGLARSNSYHAVDFIRLAYWALHDQLFSHVIKVTDRREHAGLWFLERKFKTLCDSFCARANVSLSSVEAIGPKLQLLRDKALFHLDKKGVIDPAAIWKQADLTYGELDKAMDAAFKVLCFLHEEVRGQTYTLPEYDGSDATALAEYADLKKLPLIGNLPNLTPSITATQPSTD